jgi:hypothetical protein
VTVDPFRAPKGVPLWLPPAILGAVALGLCAALASEDTPFMDLRPLMYVAIAVVWVGASAAWLTLASLIRAERTRQALEADDDVASAAAPRSSPVSSSFEPARARPSGFGLLGVYLALSFALFCALPAIDRGVAAQQVDGKTMRAVNWFEAAAVLNLLATSIAFAYRARRKS